MRSITVSAAAALLASSAAMADERPHITALKAQPFPTASEVRLFVTDSRQKLLTQPKGHPLTPAQRRQFEKLLLVQKRPELDTPCFNPHHYFRYFDRHHREIGQISVCFCCAGVSVEGESAIRIGTDREITADYRALEKLVRDTGQPTNIPCD